MICSSPKCGYTAVSGYQHCSLCLRIQKESTVTTAKSQSTKLADKYPKYYKSTNGATEVDVYAVHQMFDIQDPSGAIQHASKKLLLSGVRTGGKSKFDDIREARDTLNRWLELNSQTK